MPQWMKRSPLSRGASAATGLQSRPTSTMSARLTSAGGIARGMKKRSGFLAERVEDALVGQDVARRDDVGDARFVGVGGRGRGLGGGGGGEGGGEEEEA